MHVFSIFQFSRLRVTYKVRKFPAIFIVAVLKIQMSLVRISNEINVGNNTKRKLKDIS
jgi:hypothetical protein